MRRMRPSLASPSLQAALLSCLLRSGATPEGEREREENNNATQKKDGRKTTTSNRESGKPHAKRDKAATPRKRKGKQNHPKKAASLPSLGWCGYPSLLFRVVVLSPPPPFRRCCCPPFSFMCGAAFLPWVVLLHLCGAAFSSFFVGGAGFFLFEKTKQKHTHNNKRNEPPKHCLTSKSYGDYCQE